MRLAVPAVGYGLAWCGDFGADLPKATNSRLSTRSEFTAALDASERCTRGECAPVTSALLESVYQGLQNL